MQDFEGIDITLNVHKMLRVFFYDQTNNVFRYPQHDVGNFRHEENLELFLRPFEQ